MKDLHSMDKKNPFLVSWIIWDRSSAMWRPIYKFIRCKSEYKAIRVKNNLLKQTSFIEVYISKII